MAMAMSKLYVPVLIAGMIITGSSNSLWSKWQVGSHLTPLPTQAPFSLISSYIRLATVGHAMPSLADPADVPRRNALSVLGFLFHSLCIRGTLLTSYFTAPGFLPVIYSLVRTRFQPAVQLPPDSDDDPVPDSPPLKPITKSQPLRGYKVLLLWLPAACDLTGTTLMNVGLLYTPVSIYQMTRGALVLMYIEPPVLGSGFRFFSYADSRASFHPSFRWLSLVTVMIGVSVVGLSGSMTKDAVKENAISFLHAILSPSSLAARSGELPSPEPIESPEATKVLVGVFFILFAQIFTATQFVVEEKIMSRYSVAPLVAVGFEGLFGFLTILIFMPVLARFADRSMFFDLPRGWHQMIDTPTVLWSGVAIACSISLFNFFRTQRYTARLSDSKEFNGHLPHAEHLAYFAGAGLGETCVANLCVTDPRIFTSCFLFNSLVNPPKFLLPRTEAASLDAAEDVEARTRLAEGSLEETAILPADLGTSGYDVVRPTTPQANARSERQSE
ncbi:hypothetical protein EW145_g2874 [Phellinidium pouzarii]|uniref:EamA domain-containing protein n=1 Tax=Phellinidium pouzarii TaxID=167371 RepID=A0A4S4L9G6_9AGAM|nr:hypothetical protein EW145_g2874 [Phellinidium pouzarii]